MCLRALTSVSISNLVIGGNSFQCANGSSLAWSKVALGPQPAAKATRAKKAKRKAYSTRYSKAVSHPVLTRPNPVYLLRSEEIGLFQDGMVKMEVSLTAVPKEPAAAELACTPICKYSAPLSATESRQTQPAKCP